MLHVKCIDDKRIVTSIEEPTLFARITIYISHVVFFHAWESLPIKVGTRPWFSESYTPISLVAGLLYINKNILSSTCCDARQSRRTNLLNNTYKSGTY